MPAACKKMQKGQVDEGLASELRLFSGGKIKNNMS
jgi:hypothetical protein